MASILLVSLNIERSLQLRRVLPLLREQKADVVALQEVYERDIPKLAEAAGTAHVFVPMTSYIRETPSEIMGVAIFSRLPIRQQHVLYYGGDFDTIPELDQEDPETWNNKRFPVLFCDVEKDGMTFRIGNIHHTWTPDGLPTALQRQHTKSLLEILQSSGEFVLCGDLNAPRGGEIFDMIAAKYKDNVPPGIISSLDPDLHRAKGLELVVDGIFSTPAYTVSGVEMISGVSDHRALLATISTTD